MTKVIEKSDRCGAYIEGLGFKRYDHLVLRWRCWCGHKMVTSWEDGWCLYCHHCDQPVEKIIHESELTRQRIAELAIEEFLPEDVLDKDEKRPDLERGKQLLGG